MEEERVELFNANLFEYFFFFFVRFNNENYTRDCTVSGKFKKSGDYSEMEILK